MKTEICRIAPLLKMLSEGFERLANDTLKKYNLTFSQIQVLGVLYQLGDKTITLKELEKSFSFSSAAIAGIVSRLEEKNYVECETHQADKRVKCVNITKLGVELMDAAIEDVRKTEEMLLEDFTKEERENFLGYLKKMYEKVVE